MKTKYMHTLEGRPAFYDGNQICYSGKHKSDAVRLVDSLEQIHAEQKASQKWRKSAGFGLGMDYDWALVIL